MMSPDNATAVARTSITPTASTPAAQPEHVTAPPEKPAWRKYGAPVLIVLLAVIVVATITRNWNAWEGGHIEQVTDDAFVLRGVTSPRT
jgi:hypothetical protein